MWNKLASFFHFNKGERNGILILLSILLLVIILPFFYPLFSEDDEPVSDEWKEKMSTFEAGIIKTQKQEKKKYYSYKNRKRSYRNTHNERKITPFEFDPNTLPDEKWKELGLSEYQINIILNYRNKGGKFFNKEDFKKIYSISDDDYAQLESYIVIDKEETPQRNYEKGKAYNKTDKALIIDINTANAEELRQLKGIGNVLSKRIVDFREALGGFTSIGQIEEVYGLSPETWENIKNQLVINAPILKKININQANLETLRNHPYISYNVARSIVAYREMHGAYQNIDEILNSDLIDEELFDKIKPYLKCKE